MSKQKIAIACQGGGSQTAFTAGVLSAFFEHDLHQTKRVVSLSGTSGGAVCASLAWFGLLKAARGDPVPIQKRMQDFWKEIMAQLPAEVAMDRMSAEMLRMIENGMLPHVELTPISALSQMFTTALTTFLPRRFFTDLKGALEEHIDFEAIPELLQDDSPVLLLGAADVLTGELKKFNSRDGEFCVEAILASAAIPTLFPAVEINGHHYWDGLFSDNPPIKELMRGPFVGGENIPDEIWVIQINPTEVDSLPSTNGQIFDRRNQMEGNVSLRRQSLEFVEFCNYLLSEKAVDYDVLAKHGFTRREPITVRTVHMSPRTSVESGLRQQALSGAFPHIGLDRRWREARQRVRGEPRTGIDVAQGITSERGTLSPSVYSREAVGAGFECCTHSGNIMKRSLVVLMASLTIAGLVHAVAQPDAPAKQDVVEEKQTSLGLYVTSGEAFEMWKARSEQVKILDVRTPEEYIFVGHAEMAWNIPLAFQTYRWDANERHFAMQPNPDFVADTKEWAEEGDTILVMCRSGGRSAMAVNTLAEAGFTNVYNIVDGMEGDAVDDPDSVYHGKRMRNGLEEFRGPLDLFRRSGADADSRRGVRARRDRHA